MRRLTMILPLALLLGACADAPPPSTGPQPGVKVSFPPGALVNVIRVDALDSVPLRAAELVAPDGTATPAASLDVVNNPRANSGQATVTDPWRASMLGPNGIPLLPSAGLDPTARGHETLLLMVSTAEIPLPDPVAYHRDWAKYRVRITFATGGAPDIRELAAPPPPPGT